MMIQIVGIEKELGSERKLLPLFHLQLKQLSVSGVREGHSVNEGLNERTSWITRNRE